MERTEPDLKHIVKPLLFWDMTPRRLVVGYLRSGTSCRSHFQESSIARGTGLLDL
jgi:hypothetical protein